jgi:ADP-heptose:LPS heptosyltransferase
MPTPVIIRFGALGDMVLTTPLLRALASRHGQPCAVACCGGFVRPLYQGLPWVGEVVSIASRGAPYLLSPDQWRLVRFLAGQRDAVVYLLEGDGRSASFATRARITLAGSMRTTVQTVNHHQIEGQARVAGFIAADGAYLPPFVPVPELAVSAQEQADCRAWITTRLGAGDAGAPVVLLHPGNKKTMSWRARSGNLKDWPAERWVAVARGVLSALPAARVLVTGTAAESRIAEPIVAACADRRVVSVAGATPLRRLLALLTLAHSLVSVDTGPAHAAAALACPLVVLFGKTDPRANRPVALSSPVAVVTGPPGAPLVDGEAGWRAHHDMAGIAAETVLAAWAGLRAPPLPAPAQAPARG